MADTNVDDARLGRAIRLLIETRQNTSSTENPMTGIGVTDSSILLKYTRTEGFCYKDISRLVEQIEYVLG